MFLILGEISLVPIETGLAALAAACVASAVIVIPGAVGLRALKAGGLWLVRLFQRMMG